MNKKLMITNGGYRNAGLFSYVGQVIGNLYVSDSKNIPMWVNIPHSPYLEETRGTNCWDYYFQQPYNLTAADVSKFDIVEEKEWFDGKLETCIPTLTEDTIINAKRIVKKYIKPTLSIQNKIEKFQRDVIKTPFYGAVHFRGTDHYYNNRPGDAYPILPEDVYFHYINQLLQKFEKVLLCSDQQSFIDNATKKFGSSVVSYPSIRSNNHLAIHYNNEGSKYQTGEDVVIESYLMSYSSYLIRTCSGVTHFSIFNSTDPNFKFINIDDVYYNKQNI